MSDKKTLSVIKISGEYGLQLRISSVHDTLSYKKLSYCWKAVRCENMPRIAEMDVEMTT